MLITTTDVLQGIEISEYIGLVATYSLNTSGGMGKVGDKLKDKTMSDFNEAMQKAGEKVGADAVIGVKILFEKPIIWGFGTAVKIKHKN